MSSASQRKLGEPFARGAWGIWRAGATSLGIGRNPSHPRHLAAGLRSAAPGQVRADLLRRLIPDPADSFQKRPTRSKNGRLWKQLADSGNSWPTLETAGRLWQFGLCVVTRVE